MSSTFADANARDFERDMREAIEEAIRQIGRVNIAVFGRTGAGKSTLINAVFGEEVAKTGIGKPVTENTDYYEHPNGILGLFDSQGFEMGEAGEKLIKKLAEIVREQRDQPVSEHIHVVWYCVHASDRRFEDAQADFVRALADLGLPVMMIFTQVEFDREDRPRDHTRQFADYVTSLGLPLAPRNEVFLTNALEDAGARSPTPLHGLKELLDATFQVVPQAVAQALTAAQHLDTSRKEEASRTVIKQMTAAAAAAAAIPIPLADSAMIIPFQMRMMSRIGVLWDMPIKFGDLAGLATSAFFAQGISKVAKAAVRGLLGLIPGLNVAQTAVKSSVAATFTYAVGEAWLAVCSNLHGRDPEAITSIIGSKELRSMFVEAFKARAKTPPPEDLVQ